MQTRQKTAERCDVAPLNAVCEESIYGESITTNRTPLITNTSVSTPRVNPKFSLPDIGTHEQLLEQTQADWIQQMHECEALGWRGGDAFYDGPHDSFCFVCGSTMELFACQTCENCYHSECMTPSLDPTEVPNFWFCPHCVDRELHIPPLSPGTDFVEPKSPVAPVYPSPSSLVVSPEKQPDVIDPVARSNPTIEGDQSTPLSKVLPPMDVSNNRNPSQILDKRRHTAQSAAKSRPRPTEPFDGDIRTVKAKRDRSKGPSPPPRKKSKYSAFSIEVDKALAVLYSELETAAQYGKSEGNLQNKVQSLEQALKLQQGQMSLSAQELESLRTRLTQECVESARLKSANVALTEEVTKLKEMAKQKESELKDWRTKLRTMMGSELE